MRLRAFGYWIVAGDRDGPCSASSCITPHVIGAWAYDGSTKPEKGHSTFLHSNAVLHKVEGPLFRAPFSGPEPPAGFEDLAVAISEQRAVVIAYDGGTRGPADRRITRRAMLQSNGRQYLIAYCHAAEIEKTYRLDRIRRIHATDR
jgi:hypothetical protein